jgi:predicted nucleic acid-binding protein
VKIIVDTNIIFSGLLNTNGSIGDLILNSEIEKVGPSKFLKN